ncbi:uncharacterized protein LOC21385155 [Morus notabilis]|uniref:uncharacterized protein LOC21385155 n=1 Tax=Morus notabilis TaxID=981085 RepID=UPI000CECFCB6|nr:uncharacterized protein LOC21385155 [Morus notabilis]
MAIVGVRTLAMAIFVITGTLMVGNYHSVSAESCKIDVPGLVLQCSKYVSKSGPKIPPSLGCCSVVKTINVPCACNLLTKDVEKMVDMEKAVYVVRTCGLDVPKGMKCGSKNFHLNCYTVPDARKEIVA